MTNSAAIDQCENSGVTVERETPARDMSLLSLVPVSVNVNWTSPFEVAVNRTTIFAHGWACTPVPTPVFKVTSPPDPVVADDPVTPEEVAFVTLRVAPPEEVPAT